ncbi:MAG: trigger factor [Candidatus Kerfeldbacteria bacterium]|nr:trigger factor [Candidatus Kerfeldbacteria bacterium]
MNITQTIQEKTTIVLTIELLPEELKPYLDKATQAISKDVKVDGFRPGHVPFEVLKTKVGEMEIYQEAAQLAIRDTLPTAIQRQQLNFVGRPQINVEKLAPGNSFVFTATVAVLPTVNLKEYQTVRVTKPPVTVDEQKFQQTMEHLRQLRSTTAVVDRPAVKGDRVTINFDIKLAGVSVEGGQGQDVPVTIGEQQFIPGFEENIIGMKAGETKQFALTFPENYGAKQLAGKHCDCTLTIKIVNQVTLPPLNEDLAKQLNFKSLAELQEAVRKNITSELERKIEDDFEVAVLEAVMQQAEFDPIPQPLLDEELDRMLDELKQQVEDQGGKFDDYLAHVKKTPDELRTSWNDRALKRVKSALIVRAVADQHNITITEDQITTEVDKQKQTYKDYPELKGRIESMEFRGYTRTMLRNQLALEKLKDLTSTKI